MCVCVCVCVCVFVADLRVELLRSTIAGIAKVDTDLDPSTTEVELPTSLPTSWGKSEAVSVLSDVVPPSAFARGVTGSSS